MIASKTSSDVIRPLVFKGAYHHEKTRFPGGHGRFRPGRFCVAFARRSRRIPPQFPDYHVGPAQPARAWLLRRPYRANAESRRPGSPGSGLRTCLRPSSRLRPRQDELPYRPASVPDQDMVQRRHACLRHQHLCALPGRRRLRDHAGRAHAFPGSGPEPWFSELAGGNTWFTMAWRSPDYSAVHAPRRPVRFQSRDHAGRSGQHGV